VGKYDLEGKIALITGSSRGIGRAIAERLSLDGASIVINYIRNEDQARELAVSVEQTGGRVQIVQADVAKAADVEHLFEQATKHFGRIDIVVNNAGIRISKKIAEISEKEFDTLFAINLKGTFLVCRQAARRLPPGGRIVNISTTITKMMVPDFGIYAASKAAVDQITRALARELGARGITVNAVAPGSTDTELFREGKTRAQIEQLAQAASLGRIAGVGDIADVVAFLVSDEARWISGQVIHANGGLI
jgi:3-oxoacyl-[acyl-carrier protein] reductase